MLVEEDAELEVMPSGRISCSSLVACSTVLLPGQPGLGEDRVGYDDNKSSQLQQKKEITERLREVEKLRAEEAELTPELNRTLIELENECNQAARESAGAFIPKSRVPRRLDGRVARREGGSRRAPGSARRREQQQNEQILKEALPSIGASVILAVLRVSRGQVDLAFNALLEMTDPDVVRAGGRRTFRPGSCHPELEAA
ncbi:hypothetical protein NKR19_g4867 [Coniochaeta hoffmannii]|uniref:CUE domain-containing protein n=1 Tax=Coniochaeta hoffmannii TaxID=91930 RepID=A0AA38RVR1_9PEZI|nr:hypothetical protein NKR19_g4867 [Coniochaeta hoffmannii]